MRSAWRQEGSGCAKVCKPAGFGGYVRPAHRDVAQLGRALDWGSRGRGFKSRRPDWSEGFRAPLFDLREPTGEPMELWFPGQGYADCAALALRIRFMAVAPLVSAGLIS